MAEKEKEAQEKGGVVRREERGVGTPTQRENPFGMMRRLVEQMDRMFEDFGFGGGLSPRIQVGRSGFGESVWAPDVDIFERDGNVVVRADLPGLKRDEVQVEIRDGALAISGERRHEQERREGSWYRTERSYGRFYREVPLPEGVDLEKAQAMFEDGVLEVTMPAPPARGARRIEIMEGARNQSAGRRAAS